MSARAPILDQYNGDPTLTHLLVALEDHPRALQAVKTASFDKEAAESLPSRAFAWETERRFPVHTREDTIASLAYRVKFASAVPPEVDEKLSDAAEAYGVDPSLFAPAPGRQKVAAAVAEPNYAVPSQKRLPLGSPEQIKLAEAVLLRDGHALPLEERVQAFHKVASAAKTAGLPTADDTSAYAAQNACNTHVLRDRVGMRAAQTKVAACAAAYDELDVALAKAPPMIYDRGQLLKLASRLHELDEQAGITGQYGKKIFDPMKTVFNDGRVKVSSDVVDLGTKQVPVETLMQLPPEVWEQLDAAEVGKVAASGDAATFKQVFDTLPRDMKITLAAQLR